MKNTLDHRVRITHELLKQALIDCLKERPIKDVTVKELCGRAQINRSTFYAHFDSIYQLIEVIEEDLLKQITDMLAKGRENIVYFSKDVFYDLFKLAKECADLFEILLIKNADPHFVEKVFQIGENLFEYVSHKTGRRLNTINQIYYYASVINGIVAVIKLWISRGMIESEHDMAETTRHIITMGIGYAA